MSFGQAWTLNYFKHISKLGFQERWEREREFFRVELKADSRDDRAIRFWKIFNFWFSYCAKMVLEYLDFGGKM